MQFTKKKIREILNDVWEESYNSVPKNDVVKEVLTKYNINEADDVPLPPAPKEGEERIYSVKDLLNMSLPAHFIHKDCGKCHLEDYENGRKMVFDEQQPDGSFLDAAGVKNDTYPFDMPMKAVYEE